MKLSCQESSCKLGVTRSHVTFKALPRPAKSRPSSATRMAALHWQYMLGQQCRGVWVGI
jgi:hypothetical protein